MPIHDFLIVVQWWFVFFLFGIVTLSFIQLLFARFLDKGYVFSKIFALAISSYLIFTLTTFHIFAFQLELIFAVIGILFAGNCVIAMKQWKQVSNGILNALPLMLFEELLFFIALLSWAYVRAHEPSLHGLEKFMDFGFVNSSIQTQYPPVKDMWYTPLPINYYYFGHFITAVLTKFSMFPSSITYNLMLATLFAFAFVASFSLGLNFYVSIKKDHVRIAKAIACGLLAGFLVSLSGNLHTVYAFFGSYDVDNPVPVWQVANSCKTADNKIKSNCFALEPKLSTFPNSYWYPNATRFIPYTIHEFPIYSFVVSDLHGHVIDIPFVLFMVAVLFVIFLKISSLESNPVRASPNSIYTPLQLTGNWLIDGGIAVLLGFFVAVLYMTNASDGVIYLGLTGLLLFVLNFIKTKNSIETMSRTLFQSLIIFALYSFFTLPFSLFFKPFVSGLGILCAPDFLTKMGKLGPFLFEKDHCSRSSLYMLVTLWGFFYFFVISFVVFLFAQRKKIPLQTSDMFVGVMMFTSTLLILFPEIGYIKDIYPMHYRANTMFKFGYQAFMMLGISSAYTIFRLSSAIQFFKLSIVRKFFSIVYFCMGASLLFLVAIYPYFAINSYYGDLKTYSGLDGLVYIKASYPDDYNAIQWLRKTIPGQPVILEGVGDSYTDYARISANTGLPTVIGWPVHEWLWRGSYDVAAPRITEAQTIYETQDLQTTKALLQKYQVKFVYVGDLERQKYPHLSEDKFKQLGTVVFQSGNTRIYQLR